MTDWHLIVGLGNPGKKYEETRHNVGFHTTNELARRHGLTFGKTERKVRSATGVIGGKKVILAQPQTFMNLSGEAVRALVDFYKIELNRLLVVHDDLDIPFKTLRIRPFGGSGGQNGMKSIIQHLGTQNFARVRWGIGRPPGRMNPADWVMVPFTGDDKITAQLMNERAADAIELWLAEGIDTAMNRYNGDIDVTESAKPTPQKDRSEG